MNLLVKQTVTAILVAMLTLFTFMPQADADDLIEYIIHNVGKGDTSVTIENVRTGKQILHVKGDIPRRPASNLKLLTGHAALQLLGENHRFKTEIYTNGYVENGVLNGDVFLKGYGDPTLMYKDLVTIGMALKKQGIDKIDGHILGDDSYFSGSQLPPGVHSNEESEYYAARVSALTLAPNKDYDAGTIIIEVTPNEIGQIASFKQLPGHSNVNILNQAKTTPKGTSNTISVKRKLGTNDIVISGQIPEGDSVRKWVTVLDPTITTLSFARTAFKKAGIELRDGSWYWRQMVKPEYTLLYTHESIRLSAMYPTFMKLSNNVMADAFLKTIGAEIKGVGDFASGAAAVDELLQVSGISFSNTVMLDGSGLSHQNRLTTNELAAFLNKVRGNSTFPTFFAGLPVGGAYNRLIGGTLRHRFQGYHAFYVAAKTGYIPGVYALSGYVKTRNGNEYVVSIMSENNKSSKINQIDHFIKYLIDYY